MNEIIFLVEDSPDGGYTARALDSPYSPRERPWMSFGITSGRPSPATSTRESGPRVIRLHYVRDEVLTRMKLPRDLSGSDLVKGARENRLRGHTSERFSCPLDDQSQRRTPRVTRPNTQPAEDWHIDRACTHDVADHSELDRDALWTNCCPEIGSGAEWSWSKPDLRGRGHAGPDSHEAFAWTAHDFDCVMSIRLVSILVQPRQGSPVWRTSVMTARSHRRFRVCRVIEPVRGNPPRRASQRRGDVEHRLRRAGIAVAVPTRCGR